jgi:hypothetical protein
MKRLATLLLAAVALLAAAAIPASASAKDRNHDRIPDKWEKRHHLSLHHNQAGRDQDRDGMKNRAEWKYGMDPRDKDSDDDGIHDNKENAGTVKSFADGVLTISLAKGGEVTGAVTDATKLKCKGTHDAGDDHGDDGPTHDQGDDHGDDGPTHDAGDDHGDDGPTHDAGDDHGDDNSGSGSGSGHSGGDDDNSGPGASSSSVHDACSTDALVAGAVVREAQLKLTDGSATWRKVELLG